VKKGTVWEIEGRKMFHKVTGFALACLETATLVSAPTAPWQPLTDKDRQTINIDWHAVFLDVHPASLHHVATFTSAWTDRAPVPLSSALKTELKIITGLTQCLSWSLAEFTLGLAVVFPFHTHNCRIKFSNSVVCRGKRTEWRC